MAAPTPFSAFLPEAQNWISTRISSPVAPVQPLGRLGPRHQHGRPPQKPKETVEKKRSVPLSYSFLVTARLSRPFRAPRMGCPVTWGIAALSPRLSFRSSLGTRRFRRHEMVSTRKGLAFCRLDAKTFRQEVCPFVAHAAWHFRNTRFSGGSPGWLDADRD